MEEIESTMRLLDVNESFKLFSPTMRLCDFNRYSNFLILPEYGEWSFRLLSTFMNELDGWSFDSKNGCRSQMRANGPPYTFMKIFSINNPSHQIKINISSSITVKATKSMISSWQKEKVGDSSIKYYLSIDVQSNSSKVIIRNSSMLYYSDLQFSSLFHSFSASFVDNQVAPFDDDTAPIYNFYDTFLNHKYYEKIDYTTFKKSTEGYMILYLIENNDTKKHLDTVVVNEKTFFILGGSYFSPFIEDIVKDPRVNGILLDTTWHALRNYVTSIPTLSIQNVGVPIGFQFGLSEDETIYSDFFTNFENVYGFKLPSYIHIAESDQGPALKTSIDSQGMQQILCLRHFLVSLGTGPYSAQVGKLVSCTCSKDYKELKAVYEASWSELSDESCEELNDVLNKAGLKFDNEKIIKIDKEKWHRVSMKYRCACKMPSCTNSLESSHGHINSGIPRRNELWSSLKKLIEEIHKRCHNFQSNFRHNLARHKRKINSIFRNTPDGVMQSMIHHYQTNINTHCCMCGESKLLSEMLGVVLPCSHLRSLGMEFPDICPPQIVFKNSTGGDLFVEFKYYESEEIQVSFSYFDKIRVYVYKIIKRYSHSKDKTKIKKYVNDNLPFKSTPQKFVLGYPVEVFSVIDQGIAHFYKKKI